jgi:hypothetical protein
MRYLKAKINESVVEYIPLDDAEFAFYERSKGKYRIGVFLSGKHISLTGDKDCVITSLDDFMRDIVDIPERGIVDVQTLFEKYGGKV